MKMLIHAILAVLPALGLVPEVVSQRAPNADPPAPRSDSPPPPPPVTVEDAFAPEDEPPPFDVAFTRTVDPPRRAGFRLVDGVRLRGDVTHWGWEGIDGTFGGRRWSAIHPRDRWDLILRVVAPEEAEAWIHAGAILLWTSLEDEAETPPDEIERAFTRALRIDPGLEARIAHVRRAVRAEIDERRAEAARDEAERLRLISPEAQAWSSDLWPELTDEERVAAINTMRSDAEGIVARAGVAVVPIETNHFLFYADLPRDEASRWVRELDVMYARLAEQFGLAADDTSIFWGKAVIFVWKDQDRYRLVEADAFNHLAPSWSEGICHPIGPKVFVNFYRQPDARRFAAILVHETVHGFMHRYRTPRRLPTWANEGFSDYVASVIFRESPIDAERRGFGVRQIRRGLDVNRVLDMTYGDGTWPGPGNVGYSIGYLLVELMIRERPAAFRAWVDAIKAGKDWEAALREDYGVDRRTLVETFVQWYRVND